MTLAVGRLSRNVPVEHLSPSPQRKCTGHGQGRSVRLDWRREHQLTAPGCPWGWCDLSGLDFCQAVAGCLGFCSFLVSRLALLLKDPPKADAEVGACWGGGGGRPREDLDRVRPKGSKFATHSPPTKRNFQFCCTLSLVCLSCCAGLGDFSLKTISEGSQHFARALRDGMKLAHLCRS